MIGDRNCLVDSFLSAAAFFKGPIYFISRFESVEKMLVKWLFGSPNFLFFVFFFKLLMVNVGSH